MEKFSAKNKRKILDSMPGATDVRSRKEWEAAGRVIAPGARPLYVWAPMYFRQDANGQIVPANWKECPVYDVAQTSPAESAQPDQVKSA